jgi:hypothetical protein
MAMPPRQRRNGERFLGRWRAGFRRDFDAASGFPFVGEGVLALVKLFIAGEF